MKKMIFAVLVAVIATVSLNSCGPFFGNVKQYDDGEWYGVTGSGKVAIIKRDKLSLQKLEMTPAKMAVIKDGKIIEYEVTAKGEAPAGFMGIVVNHSQYYRINFIIKGPEVKGYLLGPGQSIEPEYLTPGQYTAHTFKGGSEVGKPWTFTVGSRQHNYLGKTYHWYVYYED